MEIESWVRRAQSQNNIVKLHYNSKTLITFERKVPQRSDYVADYLRTLQTIWKCCRLSILFFLSKKYGLLLIQSSSLIDVVQKHSRNWDYLLQMSDRRTRLCFQHYETWTWLQNMIFRTIVCPRFYFEPFALLCFCIYTILGTNIFIFKCYIFEKNMFSFGLMD